ncbi:MAG TPA: DUF16 domain-containing protein [Hyphomicrobiaceae bacterium]|nr:DUF16 domain-containing protein [Hyphomicrobiaceae bacterium]
MTALDRAQGDTTETLRWVVTKLARMQAVQDEHTLRLDRLETKVDQLGSRVDQLGEQVDQLGGRVDQLGERVDQLGEQVDRLEAKLDKNSASVDALPRVIAEMIEASEKRIMAAVSGRG